MTARYWHSATRLPNGKVLVAGGLGSGYQGGFAIHVPAGQTVSTNTAALGVTRSKTGAARFRHNGPPGSISVETAIANFGVNPAFVQPVKFQAVREAK